MHKFFTSLYDASVYLQQPEQNAGRDEVIEIGKLYYGDIKDIYRTLIKFDLSEISSSFSQYNITGSYKVYLNLKSQKAEEIPLEYTIYANAVSQSWAMGSGTKFDNLTSDGVSWKYRDGVTEWQPDTIAGTAVFAPGTTGSADAEGGTWYTASQASQSYNYEPEDVRMDVTGIVSHWMNGTLPNNGFIVHHSLEAESDTKDYGALKFFSKETNTIYEPKLELVWDSSIFNPTGISPVTGSISDDDYKVIITNLKTKYPKNTLIKVRVKGRDRYPLKTFGNTFAYDQSKYLPQTTYYQIEDYITGDIIVPFGEYSKLSCDNSGNYFTLDLGTYPVNRVYKIKIKILESGISTVLDEKYTFEIVE